MRNIDRTIPTLLLPVCLLLLTAVGAWAQDGGDLVETIPDDAGLLVETLLTEEGGGYTLVLDNTRTKLGRDFYESFYQQWASLPVVVQGDSAQKADEALENLFTIMIDESPTPGLASLVSITINDLLVWQQVVQPRLGNTEALAENAVGLLREYVVNYQEIQRQLGSEDQMGSGIY
jgi:hypothetical protein